MTARRGSTSAEDGRRFLETNKIQPLLEELLLELARRRPEDLFGFISDWALTRREPRFARPSSAPMSRSPSRVSISGSMSPPAAVDGSGGGFNRQCNAILIGRNQSKLALLDILGGSEPAERSSKALQLHRQHMTHSLEKVFGGEAQSVVRICAHERNLQSVVLLAVEQELVSLPLIRAAGLCTMAVLVIDDERDGADDHASWEVCLRQLLMCCGVGIGSVMLVRRSSEDAAVRRKILSMILAALTTCGYDSHATPIVDFGATCKTEVIAAVQVTAPRKIQFDKRLSKHVRCSLRAVKLAIHVKKTYRAFSDGTAFSCTVQSCVAGDFMRVGDSGEVELEVVPVASTLGESAPICLFVDGSVFAFGYIISLARREA
jgi:hypothetical protein